MRPRGGEPRKDRPSTPPATPGRSHSAPLWYSLQLLVVPAPGGASQGIPDREIPGFPPKQAGGRQASDTAPTFSLLTALCIAAQKPSLPRTRPYRPAPPASSPSTPGVTIAKKTQSRLAVPMPQRQPHGGARSETREPPAAPVGQGWSKRRRRALEGGPLNSGWHHVLALRAHLQAVWGRDAHA